ncbi:uncharacterized protein LOC103316957 isoform X2 [Nasonia vitripennis]|uniref:Uncharacterized protein n=1 Tax=Nasonia vitripennis TaxID=7425 RepID=A0A7M7R3C0_NASVI|nr:uncharacterized protein LOC103316957 isoform X2 [Nasonia vitripennis]
MSRLKKLGKSEVRSSSEPRSYKYNPDWEKESWAKGWLTKSKEYDKQAHCMACNKNYRAHHKDLQKLGTEMVIHKQNMDKIHIKQKKNN